MPALRALPSRPSLEYERKEAKALHRRLRAGDPEALARARARHPRIDASDPARIRLADAQFVIAREYGFSSWPRLVHYLGDVERQQHAELLQLHGGRGTYEGHVHGLLAGHRAGSAWVGRALAAYVPHFYGMRVDDVFASVVDEDDARLVVARMHGAPSWEVLLERVDAARRTEPGDWEADPMPRVVEAMAAADLGALQRVVAAHPELLHPSEQDAARGRTLMWMALGQERRRGAAAMQPVMDWLAAHGFDRQRELNVRLCGHLGMRPEEVRDLLDLGADANWIAPNGLPVLEHALLRYWNGEAVDVLAAHAVPRKSLWIAAGLGDVDGARDFLDRRGKPTPAARRLRPDFVAAGAPGFTPLPDATDEEVLMEALVVAMLNARPAVLEYMASRGAPVNSLIFGWPLIKIAVGNGMTTAVECLVRCGADLDLRGGDADGSARELARELFEQQPQDARRRRIVELCGMDPDVVAAERDAHPTTPPPLHATLRRALAFASEDAARLGQSDVRPENLLLGLLRGGGPPLYFLKGVGRLDVERSRAELGDRVAPTDDGSGQRPELPMNVDARVALEAAIALAAERRADSVYGLHLLHALTRVADGPVARLLARYGVSAGTINAELERV